MDIISLFPVRCVSCNKVLGDKQIAYEMLLKQKIPIRKALDMLGIDRFCCRMAAISPIQLPVPVDIPAESAIESRSGIMKNPLRKVGEWVRAGQSLKEAVSRLNPEESQQISRILERLTQLLQSSPKLAVEKLIQTNQPLVTVVSKLELNLPTLILPQFISEAMILDQLFFNLEMVPGLLDLLGDDFRKIYTEYQESPDALMEAKKEKRITQESDFLKSIYLTIPVVRDDPTNIIQKIKPLLVPGGSATDIVEEFIKAGLTFDQVFTLLGIDIGPGPDLPVGHSVVRVLENILRLTPFYESFLTHLKITAREGQIGTGLEGDFERMSIQRPIMSTPGGALDAMTNAGQVTVVIPGAAPRTKPVSTRPPVRIPGMPTRPVEASTTRPPVRIPGMPTRPVEAPRPPVRIPGMSARPVEVPRPSVRIAEAIPAAPPSVPAVPTAVAEPVEVLPPGPSKLELPPIPRVVTLPTVSEFGLPIYRAV